MDFSNILTIGTTIVFAGTTAYFYLNRKNVLEQLAVNLSELETKTNEYNDKQKECESLSSELLEEKEQKKQLTNKYQTLEKEFLSMKTHLEFAEDCALRLQLEKKLGKDIISIDLNRFLSQKSSLTSLEAKKKFGGQTVLWELFIENVHERQIEFYLSQEDGKKVAVIGSVHPDSKELLETLHRNQSVTILATYANTATNNTIKIKEVEFIRMPILFHSKMFFGWL